MPQGLLPFPERGRVIARALTNVRVLTLPCLEHAQLRRGRLGKRQ